MKNTRKALKRNSWILTVVEEVQEDLLESLDVMVRDVIKSCKLYRFILKPKLFMHERN